MLSSIVSPLDGFRSPFGPQRGFNPASLFRNGEQGWLYDLSDMSTLFQDAAGTTPVTAVGQPVGLQLDKSKGLVLGPELVNDGTFSGGSVPAGWVSVGGTGSVSNGRFNVTASGGAYTGMEYPLAASTFVGRSYVLEATLVSGTGRITIEDAVSDPSTPNIDYLGPRTFRVVVQRDSASLFTLRLRTAVNGATSVWDNISVRELPGNHRSQSISLNRPTLRQDTNGLYYLEYDGLNDSLSTAPFAWGSDKATVVAGVRKLSDEATGVLVEHGNASTGGFFFLAPASSAPNYGWGPSGSILATRILASGFSAPITNVLAGVGDISTDTRIIRVNGVQVNSDTSTDLGTGNFGTHPVFFGARDGTSLFFNGWEYSNVGISRLLTTGELAALESWTAGKAGNTL